MSMDRQRTDLDIPEGTNNWPGSEKADGAPRSGPDDEPPISLDPDRDTAERNAAAGGWDGANEQIENDFEAEQLRRGQNDPSGEDVPLA